MAHDHGQPPATAHELTSAPPPPRRAFWLAALLLYTAMTAAATYPQIRGLSDRIPDVGDPLLNVWALAWVAHQMPFAPAHVFDGNIFHPERRTLAYSESLIAPALLGAPLLWLGAGPVLVYNLLLLGGFVVSGVGMALLVLDLTGRRSAALVAGAVFALLPYRLDHYSHFQLLQTQWMPLALWSFHRLVRSGAWRDGLMLGLWVGAQALTSMYNALFLVAFMAALVPWLLFSRGPWRARLVASGLAVVVAGVLTYPVAVAHVRARDVVGERSRDEAVAGSATWSSYLSASARSRVHGEWSHRFGRPELRLFPGVAAIGLAIVGLWPPLSLTRLAYAAATLVAVDISRGFNGLLYPLLYEWLSPLRGLRVPARMGLMVGLGLAVLAGFGVARLLRGATPRRVALATTALLGVVLADGWGAPLALTRVPTEVPLIYEDMLRHKGDPPRATLARLQSDPPPTVLLELPIHRDAPMFMYFSTFHWQTLVNGYSGFFSGRYLHLNDTLQRFPDPESIAALTTLGVRYVTIHGQMLSPRDYQGLIGRLDRMAPEFRLVNRRPWDQSEISLYRFTPSLK